MCECALRVRRHRSNRRRTPSSRAGSSPVFLVFIGCSPQRCGFTAYDTTRLKTIHARSPEGHTLTTGARAVITDPASGEQVGVSVGTITGTRTLSASLLTPDDLAGISLGPGESVVSAWTFTSDPNGAALLSFDVGRGLSDLHAWRYANSTWTAYDTHIVYRDDIASFTVTGFSGYAVTAVPGTLALPAIGLAALGLYWRKGTSTFFPTKHRQDDCATKTVNDSG